MTHPIVQFDSRQLYIKYMLIYIRMFFNLRKKRLDMYITEEMEKMCPPFSSLRVGFNLISTKTFKFQVTYMNQMTTSYCVYKSTFVSVTQHFREP